MSQTSPIAIVTGLAVAGIFAGATHALLAPAYQLTEVGSDHLTGSPIVLKVNGRSGKVEVCLVHPVDERFLIRCDGSRRWLKK